ncbi:Proline--tRNA ligase [bioreactor metagenome]|uniref:proline--tRNA ligase n=1 Tax=bioreactor metagenome TaxID=1076179 RepID=A0A645IJ81_9ZZZZ
MDTQQHLRPGDRFFFHLQKGVPLRLELGEKEFTAGKVKVVRRDTGEKIDISWEELGKRIPELLDEIQKNLFDRALKFRKENTYQAADMAQFREVIESKGGFVEVFFDGSKEDEKAIKEATGATPRCYPLEYSEERGKCFYTGKEGARKAIFAKAY